MKHSTLLTFTAGVALCLLGLLMVVMATHPATTSASSIFTAVVPKVGTTSTAVVGTQSVTTLFAVSSACTDRVITTVAKPIMLSFSSAMTPTGAIGHLQAASTTTTYDNSQYGCGAVTAYGFDASTTVSLTEFQQH